MLNSAQIEANKLIEKIQSFWGDNVLDIQVNDLTDSPFDMFTLFIKLYGVYAVKLIYDRSTLGINLEVNGQFVGLSRLTSEPIFKGFEGYEPENLLHNFMVLDRIIKKLLVNNGTS